MRKNRQEGVGIKSPKEAKKKGPKNPIHSNTRQIVSSIRARRTREQGSQGQVGLRAAKRRKGIRPECLQSQQKKRSTTKQGSNEQVQIVPDQFIRLNKIVVSIVGGSTHRVRGITHIITLRGGSVLESFTTAPFQSLPLLCRLPSSWRREAVR